MWRLVRVRLKHFGLLVVFVNKVCDFNRIEFTEKGVCRFVFTTLVFRFLSSLVTIMPILWDFILKPSPQFLQ